MELRIENLGFRYKTGGTVLEDINLDLSGPRLVSIIGPNGVGKSTLIHCMNRILTPTSGEVLIDGRNLKDYSLKELAKIVGYVPCTSTDAFPLTVTDTVLLGRNPHSKWGSLNSDLMKVHEVLKLLGIDDLAMRPFNELSAGQHQKVMLARGLVQEPRILLLDEPTSNLDIKHQMGVTRLLKRYADKEEVLVIMISHDLNIASKYSDEIIMLSDGHVFADGTPNEVLTSENIRAVYDVDSTVVMNHGKPHIIMEDECE